MTDNLKLPEQMVAELIATANRSHPGAAWYYVLTSEVDNIEVESDPETGTRSLRIHPCWLRYVVSQGEFTSCVADEIEAWYLLASLTGEAIAAA